jgi:hypothetical protein
MAEIPAAALTAAERAIIEAATDFGQDDIVAGSSRNLARAALEAAAPVLAETIAQKILLHMQEHDKSADPASARAWRRHFGIAARVAAGAFYTEDDLKRLAAEAIARGDFIISTCPEVPDAQ